MKTRSSSLASVAIPATIGAIAGGIFFLGFFERDSGNESVSEHEAAVLEVYRTLKVHYIDKIGEEELATRAIDGMFRGLDLQSEHFLGDAVSDLHSYAASEFGGVGIEVRPDASGTLLVLSSLNGKPAARAGIRKGDQITAVDAWLTTERSYRENIDMLRGPVGSAVSLTYLSKATGESVEVTLVRDTITVNSVEFRVVEPGIAVLQISEFLNDTGDLVREQLNGLADLRGLVVDLRANPGGLLKSAVDVADCFLASGVIVKVEGRDPAGSREHLATESELHPDASLVVLLDRSTASAAELLAGALQDHGRAVLVGEPTYGKGTIQSVIPIGTERAIKLTTGRYLLPNGRRIGEEGIQPDVQAVPTEDAALAILNAIMPK